MVGRPTKLTPEVTKAICKAIEDGNTLKNAAALAGIGEKTLYVWMSKGEDSKNKQYRQFRQSVERSLARFHDKAVKAFVSSFDDDPRMALEYLSRRYPEDWAKKDNVKQEVKHGGEIVVKWRRVDANGNDVK